MPKIRQMLSDEYLTIDWGSTPKFPQGRVSVQHLSDVNDVGVKTIGQALENVGNSVYITDLYDSRAKLAKICCAGKKSKCDQHLEELFNQTDDEVELLPNELKRKPRSFLLFTPKAENQGSTSVDETMQDTPNVKSPLAYSVDKNELNVQGSPKDSEDLFDNSGDDSVEEIKDEDVDDDHARQKNLSFVPLVFKKGNSSQMPKSSIGEEPPPKTTSTPNQESNKVGQSPPNDISDLDLPDIEDTSRIFEQEPIQPNVITTHIKNLDPDDNLDNVQVHVDNSHSNSDFLHVSSPQELIDSDAEFEEEIDYEIPTTFQQSLVKLNEARQKYYKIRKKYIHMKKIKAGQVELMPNSGVYIPELLYKSVKASSTDGTRAARKLLTSFFTPEILRSHSLLGLKGTRTAPEVQALPEINKEVRDAIIGFALQHEGYNLKDMTPSHKKYNDFKKCRQRIIKSLSDLLRSERKKNLQGGVQPQLQKCAQAAITSPKQPQTRQGNPSAEK